MAEIRHYLTINGTPEKVYAAITTREGLAAWWTTDAEAKPEEGSVASFGFNSRQVAFRMRIEKLEPPGRVEWACIGESNVPEWPGTRLFFDIRPEGDRVGLNFGHLFWKNADGALPRCSFDWAGYLMSLRDYIETGKGRPHQGG